MNIVCAIYLSCSIVSIRFVLSQTADIIECILSSITRYLISFYLKAIIQCYERQQSPITNDLLLSVSTVVSLLSTILLPLFPKNMEITM